MAQQPNKFDGKYTGNMKCTPAGNYRFNGNTISNDQFSTTFNIGGQAARCTLKISPDGTFSNQTCDLPTSGKIVGDKLSYSVKHQNGFCEVSAMREKN